MPLVNAKCTNCGQPLKVDNAKDAAVCEFCGSAFIVEKAINNYNTINVNDFSGANVIIDNHINLTSLYSSARRLKKDCRYSEALDYYKKILEQDSNSWEAYYSIDILQAFLCSKSEVMDKTGTIVIGMDTVLDMIANNENEDKKIISALEEYGESCLKAADILHERILIMDNPNIPLTSLNAHLREIAKICIYIASICYMVGDKFNKKFPQFYEQNKQLYAKAWKQGVKYHEDCNNYLPNREEGRNIINDYVTKIKKIDNNYSTSTSLNSSTSTSTGGGCYVATAVYGSYDCPEVWTLRRYRDYSLALTWYGRLFIALYYAISPTIVKWFGDTNWFNKMWKGRLDKMVKRLQEEGFENTPYEDKNW